MDNEIQLNHLAPYLPYDLQIKILNHKSDYVGIEYSVITGYYFLNERLHVTYKGGSTGKSNNEFMPILKPLSDLLNPIDKNKKFGKNRLDEINEEPNSLIGDCSLTADLCLIQNVSSDSNFMSFTYMEQMSEVLNILYKDHYDVHGLIGKGLAIDINNSNTELKEE